MTAPASSRMAVETATADLDRLNDVLHSEVRPALSAHLGSVEIVEVHGSHVHLRMVATCSACYFRRACAEHLVVETVQNALPGVTCTVDNARHA